jgi:hypothetical protein
MKKRDDDDEHPVRKTADLANSSVKAGPNVINTVAGPIREWLPCPENLPNHATMVLLLCGGLRLLDGSGTIDVFVFEHVFGKLFGFHAGGGSLCVELVDGCAFGFWLTHCAGVLWQTSHWKKYEHYQRGISLLPPHTVWFGDE